MDGGRLQGAPSQKPDATSRSRLMTPPALPTGQTADVERTSTNNYWKDKRLAFEI
eukprot:COSAG02_NODE_48326_length_334_cov_1.102128_1_plen_54_part_10